MEEQQGFGAAGPSSPIEAYYVVQLDEIKPSYLPELEEIRSDVETAFKLKQAETIAEQKATEVLEAIHNAIASATPVSSTQTVNLVDFSEPVNAPQKTGASYRGPIDITGMGQVTNIGRAIPLAKTALAMKPGEISGPVKNYRMITGENNEMKQGPMTGVYILQVLGKSETPDAPNDPFSSFNRFMEQQVQSRAFNTWIEEVSATAQIEYNANMFAPYEDETVDEIQGSENGASTSKTDGA